MKPTCKTKDSHATRRGRRYIRNNYGNRYQRIKNEQIALADPGFGKYSVRNSGLHQVTKWGWGAWMCGGKGATGSMEGQEIRKL